MSDKDHNAPAAWPNWRDAESYRHLLDLDRAGWAWEWLRRNPDYVRDRRNDRARDQDRRAVPYVIGRRPEQSTDPQRWGLCFR